MGFSFVCDVLAYTLVFKSLPLSVGCNCISRDRLANRDLFTGFEEDKLFCAVLDHKTPHKVSDVGAIGYW